MERFFCCFADSPRAKPEVPLPRWLSLNRLTLEVDMLSAGQKSTGTDHTLTAALLIGAFIVSPAVFFLSRPVGPTFLTLLILCTVACAALAWRRWKRSSELSIPTLLGGE